MPVPVKAEVADGRAASVSAYLDWIARAVGRDRSWVVDALRLPPS